MKNGMNTTDQKTAHELCTYGWTAPQISRKLKVRLEVIEAWWPQLTEEGWAAYRTKQQREREAETKAMQAISQETAVSLAREQILMEEKIRAEIRAELASEVKPSQVETTPDVPEKTQGSQAEVNAPEVSEGASVEDAAPAPVDTERSAPIKSRRRRKAAG